MKYAIIVFCILLIILAVYILIKTIKFSIDGKCCGNCSSCKITDKCSKEKTIN